MTDLEEGLKDLQRAGGRVWFVAEDLPIARRKRPLSARAQRSHDFNRAMIQGKFATAADVFKMGIRPIDERRGDEFF